MNAVKLIRGFFDALLDLPLKKRLSFEDITKMFSKDVDEIILSKAHEGKKFFSGKFRINEVNGTSFKASFETYFIVSGEEDCEIVKSEGEAIPLSRLKSEAMLQLKVKKELVFDITAPKIV